MGPAAQSDARGIPGPEDPQELVGVGLPATREDLVEMARCLIEEYALLGYDAAGVRRFFDEPFYAGSHHLTHSLGRETIETLISEIIQGG